MMTRFAADERFHLSPAVVTPLAFSEAVCSPTMTSGRRDR